MKGQVMLLTVLIVSGTILGATTIAGLLMLYQLRQATQFSQSLQAFFAADSGLEWKLYQLCKDDSRPQPLMSPETNAEFRVFSDLTKCEGLGSINAVGCSGAVLTNANPALCPRPINRSLGIVFQ